MPAHLAPTVEIVIAVDGEAYERAAFSDAQSSLTFASEPASFEELIMVIMFE